MDRNFQRALSLVLKHEGGWADHPSDPGGATMRGVTLATFRLLCEAERHVRSPTNRSRRSIVVIIGMKLPMQSCQMESTTRCLILR